jgi:hypothetical protein
VRTIGLRPGDAVLVIQRMNGSATMGFVAAPALISAANRLNGSIANRKESLLQLQTAIAIYEEARKLSEGQ